MNPPEKQILTRSSLISAEAIIGIGVTVGAIGLLFLLLGWAQFMRAAHDAAFILAPLGAVLMIVGGIAAFFGQSRKGR